MGSASGSCSHRGGVFGLSPPAPVLRDGRKRRKDKLTWVKHTLTPYFDGHLWRKYGQKVIKDAPYPRLYFRCSYREDRHCLASKLVQQVTHDDPPLYEVTYMHEHTCNAAPVPAPDAVADAVPPPETTGAALVLRFGSSGGGGNHHGAGMTQFRPSPFLMMNNFDDSGSSQLHAFFFHRLRSSSRRQRCRRRRGLLRFQSSSPQQQRRRRTTRRTMTSFRRWTWTRSHMIWMSIHISAIMCIYEV